MEEQIKKCDRCKNPGSLRKLNGLDLCLCVKCRSSREGTLANPWRDADMARKMYELRRTGSRSTWLPPFSVMRELFEDPDKSFVDIGLLYGKSKEGIARIHRVFFSGWLKGQSTGLERRGVAADGRFAEFARDNFREDPEFAPLLAWAEKFNLRVDFFPVRWGRNKTGYSKYLIKINGLICKLHRVSSHSSHWRILVGRLHNVDIVLAQIGASAPYRFFVWRAEGLRHRQHLDIAFKVPSRPTIRTRQSNAHEDAVHYFDSICFHKRMAKAVLSPWPLNRKTSYFGS